jgi:hypothetical protein
MKDMELNEWPAFHEKRMREVDELAERDRHYNTFDADAKRINDLTQAEYEALEAEVTAYINQLKNAPAVIKLRQDGIR